MPFLDMLFLEKHQCHMNCQGLEVVIAGNDLICVDKFGRPLVGRIQVVRDNTVPGRSQATLCCRVNFKRISNLKVVEGMHGKI